jgi:DNA end-binding protein Ku
MAPRANWKGFLKIAELACPVALHTAASTAERVSFNTVNRETGHRVHREFVDTQTGKPVPKEEQVKGYETAPGEYIMLEPDEIAAAVPQSDKTLEVSAFIATGELDDVYFDKPYYLAPDGKAGADAYALIRDGMRQNGVAALAQTVLFRRLRTVLIRPQGKGLIATTLHFDYEIRRAQEAFSEIADIKIKGEMIELAEHIIDTKRGAFDPANFHDRYEAAVAELIKAKMEGREIERPKPVKREKVVDLMEALRQSAGVTGRPAKAAARKPAGKSAGNAAAKPAARKGGQKKPEPRRKAG